MARTDLSRAQKAILVALVLLVAFTIRMYRLGHESFWVDEVHQIRVASQSFEEIIENYRQETAHETHDQAPLSMLITHFFVTDENVEFYARIPSVFVGVLGVFALFIFSRQLLPFSTSLLAAGFMAISPLAVWYSQDARWYSLWSFGSTLSYIALIRATDRSGARGPWVAFSIITLANLYTFVYSVFVFSAQGISLLWRKISGVGSWRSIVIFSCINIGVFLASIPVVLMIVQRAESDQFYSGTARASSLLEIPYTFLAFSTGFTIGPSLAELHRHLGVVRILTDYPALILVGLVFIPISIVGLATVLRDSRLASWILPWMVVPPLSVFLISLVMPDLTYQVRYSFAALPPFLLLLAIGISSFSIPIRRLAVICVVFLSAYSLSNFFWAEKYDKADARGATRYMRVFNDERVQLVAVGQIEYAMYYYAEEAKFDVIRGCGTQEGLEKEVDEDRAVWLISGRDWEHDTDRCLPQLSVSQVVADYETFTGIELWRLEPRGEEE